MSIVIVDTKQALEIAAFIVGAIIIGGIAVWVKNRWL